MDSSPFVYEYENSCRIEVSFMKILVVCQYYYPEVFKVTDVCEALVKDGYEVTVLTGLPNYPTGIVPDEYKTALHRDEFINGVHVLRCFERGRKKGAVNLALNYASFYFSAMKMVKRLSPDYDIVFSYQLSPIFMALPARWYKLKRHVPMFLYCCDLWPESMKMYLKSESNPIFKWVSKVSKKVYSACDYIATQSDVFVDYLKEVHGIDDSKLKYIPNFADEKYLEMDFTKESTDTFDFVFTGNIGIAQNLENVLKGFSLMCKEHNARLHIVGGGVRLDALKELTKELNIQDNVLFYGQRPVDEMPEFYKKSDACIVSLKADNRTGLTLPAKVQGYMAAGKPVIGMINGSCMAVIKDADCGFCVEANDVDGFAKALSDFCNQKDKHSIYAENSRAYFIKNFRKDIHIKAIEEQIEKALNSSIYTENMV